ncbi:CPBP family intramembrane metalloprotease [Lysinibacillus agricola]|uniref:CPBP family intramembrane metalloprotease n=1 Tax=Lysinibacillus agricola TaxID=2590012 RepID=A0ABX7AT29_9BACI|nr:MULTISPECIES: CPBP family intramembrane glutamic endopeptidase [Lysinibacillus]KOS61635.1 hypothetical protein AN161_16750 [Lysinibacillus sp. FJAT-14222]QQP12350.1 CPBP family intramembrane metalloprotease [Lysinibacillus agricola]
MRELLNSEKSRNMKKLLNFIYKTLLLVILYFMSFIIANIEMPRFDFLNNINPAWVVIDIENDFLVIIFFVLLLKTIGKKYIYLFSIEPLKNNKSYVWIVLSLFATYLIIEMVSGSNFQLRIFTMDFLSYLVLLLRVLIIVPIAEEFMYRGLLVLIPSKRIKYLMLLVSSIVFALFHDDPTLIIWLGLSLGILAIRFNNIWIPIIAHALWNLFVSFFAL